MIPETALFMHTTEVFQAAAKRTFCADVKAVNDLLPPSLHILLVLKFA